MKGFIDNYEDLQEWVKLTKNTAWNLYSGWPEKFSAQHFLAKCEDETDQDASFELLKRMIEMHTSQGGRFTIYVPAPGNRGFSTKVQIGTTASAAAAMAGVAGIGNPYAIGMIPVGEHERRLKEFEEKMRLERRIEDLESQQGSSVGALSKFMDKITEELDVNNVFNALVAVFGPKLNPNLQPLQLSGTPQQHEEDHADGSGYTYDDPRMLVFLDTVRNKFSTDEEFYTFLSRVGAFFDKNPQMAMSFFAGQNG
jgi:hypothetical protein